MAITLDRPVTAPSGPASPEAVRSPWLIAAVVASIGAGAIHAAAAGAHAEHPQTVMAFTALAALQIGWGVWALRSETDRVTKLGWGLGMAAVAGWAVAKTVGVGFVAGLDVPQPIGTPDGIAAALAGAWLMMLALSRLRIGSAGAISRPPAVVASIAAVVLALVAVNATGVHENGAVGDGHGHGVGSAASGVAPVPYDPTKPIDLGGVPGVTPQQQAAAENLVAVTLLRLPQWSDPAIAEAAGFRSIGDGFTGVEHFVNQAFMNDDVLLDPDRPESLVYDTKGGGRRLVAAMYMEKPGAPLSAVPNIGGALMQWHIHDNLCYNAAGKVAGLTDASGNCPAGLVKPVPTPMIHVWIEAHKCGPFAALEGIAGGSVPEGEAVLCDHAHGA